MTKALTEPQAWREIARRIAEEGMGWNSGLCAWTFDIWWDGLISPEMQAAMRDRVKLHLDEMKGVVVDAPYGFRFIDKPEQPGCRVLAALFLALDAEDSSHV